MKAIERALRQRAIIHFVGGTDAVAKTMETDE